MVRLNRIPIVGGLLATLGIVGTVVVGAIFLVVLVLIAPLLLLWSLNQLGLTEVELFNVWNLLAALIIILVLRGKLGWG